jgi:cellulose synthase/poly-beta-1,6-N-acetylglucosamine synthase-like glycosyltransferase
MTFTLPGVMGVHCQATGVIFTPIQSFSVFVFVLSCLIILYVLFGYPLLLWWMARRYEKPVQKDDKLRSVSIVIAVRNGEKLLERKLRSIFALNYPRELMEILIVSDGSEDRTDEIARSFESEGVRFLRVPHGGKAAALNAAVPLARREILLLNDVRQTLDADSLRNAMACFGDPSVGAVTAATYIHEGETQEEESTSLYWKYELWLRLQMTRIDSTFGCSGAFYAIRRSLWTPFPPDTLLDDVYLPLTAFFKGYRLVLEPTSKIYDYPTVLESEFRRKVRLQAGLYQMLRLMPALLTSRNRMRLHFLSGKYGRLLIPYCMIAVALATIGLPQFWRSLAAGAQLLFCGAALVDPLVPPGFPLKRITSAIRTFVVLMAASLAGVRVFFVPPRCLWKEARA